MKMEKVRENKIELDKVYMQGMPEHEINSLINQYGHLVDRIAHNKFARFVSGIDYFNAIESFKDKEEYVG